jgi:hypothetical protein
MAEVMIAVVVTEEVAAGLKEIERRSAGELLSRSSSASPFLEIWGRYASPKLLKSEHRADKECVLSSSRASLSPPFTRYLLSVSCVL